MTLSINYYNATSTSDGSLRYSAKVTGDKGVIEVWNATDREITVCDMSGMTLESEKANDSLWMASMPKGIYIVKIEGVSHKTVVK